MYNEKNITSVARNPGILQHNYMKKRLWIEGKLDKLAELDAEFKIRRGALISSPGSMVEESPTLMLDGSLLSEFELSPQSSLTLTQIK